MFCDTVAHSIGILIFNEESALPTLFDRLDAVLTRRDGPAGLLGIPMGRLELHVEQNKEIPLKRD
jgi:hypothetical protein